MAATSAPRIGVLAIQGAFREHVRSLLRCGAETVEIRTREDLEGLSGLVFPGGESTVMGKFLIEWGMMGRVRELIQSGMPVFGTCAGLILLCSDILDHPEQPRIGLLNASVRRNAFGRQIDSFTAPLELCPFPAADGNPTTSSMSGARISLPSKPFSSERRSLKRSAPAWRYSPGSTGSPSPYGRGTSSPPPSIPS